MFFVFSFSSLLGINLFRHRNPNVTTGSKAKEEGEIFVCGLLSPSRCADLSIPLHVLLQSVKWTEETVDNEFAGKKSSKSKCTFSTWTPCMVWHPYCMLAPVYGDDPHLSILVCRMLYLS